MSLTSIISKLYFRPRWKELEHYKQGGAALQNEVLRYLISRGKETEYGQSHYFPMMKGYEDFAKFIPVNTYEELKGDIDRMRHGEKNILWPGEVKWYAKSSGTTNDKSKFIPVTPEGLKNLHYQGGGDVVALYLRNHPESHIFEGRSLILGGSHSPNYDLPNSLVGDLSAILIENINPLVNFIRVPKKETALIIAFTPYRSQYERIITKPGMHYMETYNASEGFFGIQDDPTDASMLLMLDYGVFYEFLPMDELGSERPNIVPLEGVELGRNYAMLISTSCGLWRYEIGDTVQFTSRDPYKFIITGRTKYFINAFGEELIMDNAEKGLAYACEETGAVVSEYTAAPVFMNDEGKCRHQWLIEFAKAPESVPAFAAALDKRLQEINSDYEAKRFHDVTLQQLEVVVARKGVFNEWLKRKGKLGGQHKVPRLSNNRKNIDELLELNGKEPGDAELRA